MTDSNSLSTAEFLKTLTVLYAEDDPEVRALLGRFLARRVKQLDMAEDGAQGLEMYERGGYDVVVTDVKMPRMDGLEMSEKIKIHSQEMPIIVVTAFSDRDYLLRAIELGVDRYVTKPIDPDLLLDAIFKATRERARQRELDRAKRRLLEVQEQTITALARAIESRDPYTDGHQKRVSLLATVIAEDLGLNAEQIAGIRLGGLIHDIGKIQVPAELLARPVKLSEAEFGIIRTHSQAGYDIVRDVDFPWPIKDMIVQHHERLDGSGYPNGLKGDQIMIEARIIAVADVVESMSSHRPYRPARGLAAAMDEIRSKSGTQFDAAVVESCLRVLERRHDLLGGWPAA